MKRLITFLLYLVLARCSAEPVFAQTYSYVGAIDGQIFDNSGDPLNAGKVYVCTAGSTCPGTPLTSYSDTSGTPNANPVVLSSSGRGTIFLAVGTCAKFVIQTSASVTIRTLDNFCPFLTSSGTGSVVFTGSTQTLTNKTLGTTNTVTLKDNLFTLADNSDTTKTAGFELSGITTGTARVLTLPNASGYIVLRDDTATLQNKTLDDSNTVTFRDDRLTLEDNSDTSKKAVLQLSGITASTTRTFTLPDANTTLVGTDATQTLSNKTLTSPAITTTVRSRICTIPIGPTAYGSLGNATTYAAGDLWYGDIFLPAGKSITGVSILNAGTVGTDKIIVALFDAAGTKLATSALAGTMTSGANSFQDVAFTAPYSATGPARYFISLQANGTTDNFRSVAASTYVDVLAKNETGVFATIPSTFVVPTNFVANTAPIGCIY